MRVALVLAALVGLLALAAAGSSGEEWGGGLEDREVPRAFVDYAFTLGVIVLLALAAVAIWAFRERAPGPEVARPRGVSVVAFLMFMIALSAYFAITNADFARERETEPPPLPGRAPTLREVPRDFDSAPGPEFQWWVAGVVVLGVFAFVVYERRRRPQARPERTAGEELETVLTETLDELELDPDPRRAVIQAYARMERVLASHGHGRFPHEAPLEYLARVLRELDVRAEAAHALTELFERAKFSRHEIDAAMRAEAVSSLEAVRDDLRAAA